MGWIADLLKEIPSAAGYKAQLEAMEKENVLLKQKVSSFESDNKNLRQEIQRRNDIIQEEKSHNNLLKNSEMKWGCIVFAGDNKLYCPSCFHNTDKKIETSRAGSQNRFCAVCKTTIPSR